MAVLHLVRMANPKIPVLWNNTGVEYPETYAFKQLIQSEWNLEIIEAKPAMDFWSIVDKFGFPLFSRGGYADASKKCCRHLKEYPVEHVLRKYKFDLYFTGLRRHESRLRRFSAQRYGNYFHSNRCDIWKCHPLQDWTEQEVWEYHHLYKLPHNPVYDREPVKGFEIRTACWACTIPLKHGKVEFLRRNYPKLWRHLLRKGLARVILSYKTLDQVALGFSDRQIDHIIADRPCFFDRL